MFNEDNRTIINNNRQKVILNKKKNAQFTPFCNF